MRASEENGVANEGVVLCWLVWTASLWSCDKVMDLYIAQCKMLLFYAKTTVTESHNFELACLKKKKKKKKRKKKKENILAIW